MKLRHFYSTRFEPDNPAANPVHSRKDHINAINRFGRYLDHEPTLADLTAENFLAFQQWLKDCDVGEKVRYNVGSMIKRMWRAARVVGLVAVGPPLVVIRRPATTWATPSDPKSILKLFRERYIPMRLLGRSAAGIHQHENMINHFRRFLGHEPKTTDLDDLVMAKFAQYLLVSGQCHITVNKTLDKLLAQWRFLQRKGIVKTYPEIRKLPEPARIPQAWLLEQIERLLVSCDEVEGIIAGINGAGWWRALHLIIYDSGERIGAVLGLLWDDLDLDSGWLTVRAELRKGKKKPIMRKLRPATLEALRSIELPRRDVIFEWDRSYGLIWLHYKKILKRAGLATDRRSKFHRMRRTVASYFKQAGGDATELLDHSARSVTEAYLDPRIVTQVQAMDLLPAIGLKGGAA